jgi:hypothetical protein
MIKKLLLGFLLLNSTLFFAQSVSKTIQLLPDTGQTSSYTTTFGEDHDYSINTPSYTNNGNGTITDNVTGLMWQQVDGGEMTFENAITYCNTLTLGGLSGWRLPTPIEAFSIMNLQNSNPALNTTYFSSPGTPGADYWWTSTTQFGDATKVWCTNAGGGIGNKPKAETLNAGGTFNYHARAVRTITTPTTIANHFTDNGDGTITDNLTQLVWQKIPNANLVTWEDAITYAEGLTLANALDWRLPNIKELQSITNELTTNPSVFAPYFSNLGVHNYWSSTTLKPNIQNQSSAWYWSTQYGITAYGSKMSSNYVLCVRGNPTLSSTTFTKETSITIYPNPASNFASISLPKNTESYKIEITDLLGKIIFSEDVKPLPNDYKIDLEGYKDGIYFVKVTNEKMKKSFKIIVKK